MKTASPEVIACLNGTNKHYICDLYQITLADGTVLRYADYDMPIVWGGYTWACTGPVFERDKTKLSGKITVDSMSLAVTTDQRDLIGGVTWMNFAHNGGFKNATAAVYWCFMSSPGVVIGTMPWFSGPVNIGVYGGMEMGMKVKSRISKASADYPLRLYYPTCPYVLYGAGCGLNRDSFAVQGRITAMGSTTDLSTNLTKPDGYFNQGYIAFLSGSLAGATGPIKYSSAGGSLNMLSGFDSSPQDGDTFAAYPGCDRTPATCAAKFNNWSRNRATPFIPLKETVV